MTAMFLTSTAGLLVMVVLTAVISAEKLLSAGPRLGHRSAVLLVGMAALLAFT
jgi:hypothetical protein